VQPNATINRWIAAILLFDFKLVHIPADKHKGPDGLSRREPVEGEDDDDNNEDPEDWIDNALALGIWVVSWISHQQTNSASTSVWTLDTPSGDDAASFPLGNNAGKMDDEMTAIL
jgi:hypothetical protein